MIAPARMTPEREADVRALATERPYVMSAVLLEALDAMAAERQHTQQFEQKMSEIAGSVELLAAERDTALRAAEEAIAQRDANLAEADAQFDSMMAERDAWQEQVDHICYSLASIQEIGEWSTANDPPSNLIDLVEGQRQQAERALAAARQRAQQVEVPHSSAAVLGYVAVYPCWNVACDDWHVGTDGAGDTYPTQDLAAADFPDHLIAAVVRVGTDGRIG